MTRPRFSVVIPTRNRPSTLAWTLATCLDQHFDDYEVVVCDNGTTEATRQVVDEAASPRVRYLRTPRPLAMADNWDLAVSQARGEFVLVVGDDDGLLRFALREVDRIVTRVKSKLVRWEAGFYTWPEIDLEGHANYLRVPLGNRLQILDAAPTMAAVLRFEAAYVQLPTIYTSAIHRDLIDEARRRTGRVFHGRYPDVYSGFAFGFLAERYPSIDVPLSIGGLGPRSTGVANLFHRGDSALDLDFRTMNEDARLRSVEWVPDLPIFPEVPVADSFEVAKEVLFPAKTTPAVDRRQLLAHCIAGVRPTHRESDLATIRATAADDPELTTWFDQTLAAGTIKPRPPIMLRPERLGFYGGALHLDAARFGVRNIQDAVRLAENLLGFGDGAVEYSLLPAPVTQETPA
jgi:hypothetical protein